MRMIGPSKGGGIGQGRMGGRADDQVREAIGALFWIQMMIVRIF